MKFPEQFISAQEEYADYNNQVPAPYIRKKFRINGVPKEAELFITGLGFYRVFLNGTEITKCILAPYISNPDDIVYYDRYDVKPYVKQGDNVIGVILGNGMQNAYGGFVWDFEKARWRGAPMTALRLDAVLEDGTCLCVESDTSFMTHPSPLLEDELRSGERYDARLCIDDFSLSSFEDEGWKPAVKAVPPRGERRECKASVIKVYEKRRASAITPYQEGYLYDFGIDAAGICELNVTGRPGQQIEMSFGEWFHDGNLDKSNLMFPDFDSPYTDRVQNSTYICRGGGEETYQPYFTYYGFRYVYVKGVDEEQATEALLTYHVMGGDFMENGTFSCSDETANTLQELTRRATLSNFLWFPTDCPHREKNGWTGDAALSAEHMLLNLRVDDSLREWLHSVEKAQAYDGSFPGIVPTGGWGFGCGPAWDQVIVELPFCLYRLRGDLDTADKAAPSIFRYLYYISGIRNKRGLVDVGLGDWCETGKSGGGHKAPVEVTSTAICVDLLGKAMVLFEKLGKQPEYRYAKTLRSELKKAFRSYLIDFPNMTVAGCCQTSQAMAIHYRIFKEGEREAAFSRLLEMIHQNKDFMHGGALGLRVLFHVLSAHGEADLAYGMITRKEYPSYGNWIERGATALWEDFLLPDGEVHSRNHHFFGDISSWFIQAVAGIVPNPYLEDWDYILIAPNFLQALSNAGASYQAPSGKISLLWERKMTEEEHAMYVELRIQVDGSLRGAIRLPKGYEFEDGFGEKVLKSGTYQCQYRV